MAHSLNRKRPNHVFLNSLSPRKLKIRKPLLSRTNPQALTGAEAEELLALNAQELETMHTQAMLYQDQSDYFSSRFQSTFGFSHGIGGQAGAPLHGGAQGGGRQKKEKKRRGGRGKEPQMQICFSIASGGSTMTRRMDESFALMPDMRSNLGVHALKAAASRLGDAHKDNIVLPTMTPTASKMASQLRIMDELGKACRDSPIEVVLEASLAAHQHEIDRGNQESQGRVIARNETQKSLGYRQPDHPVQLISYLTQNKKTEIYNYSMMPVRRPLRTNSKTKLPPALALEKRASQASHVSLDGGTQYAAQDSPIKLLPEPLSTSKASATLYGPARQTPGLLPQHVGTMYQTVGEFGPQLAGGPFALGEPGGTAGKAS